MKPSLPRAALLLGALSLDGCLVPEFTFLGNGDAPTIMITAPGDGEVVELVGAMLPMRVDVQNFRLAAPGTCGAGADNLCGHIHATIDGTLCNASGVPYNVATDQTSFSVDLALCPMIPGMHTLGVELRQNDHARLTTNSMNANSMIMFMVP